MGTELDVVDLLDARILDQVLTACISLRQQVIKLGVDESPHSFMGPTLTSLLQRAQKECMARAAFEASARPHQLEAPDWMWLLVCAIMKDLGEMMQ